MSKVICKYIKRCNNILDGTSGEDPGALVEEIISIFAKQDDLIKSGLDRYRLRAFGRCDQAMAYDDMGDVRKLLGKLELLKEEEEKRSKHDGILSDIAKSNQGPTAVAVSSSQAMVSMNITKVLHNIDSIDKSEVSLEEKEEIKTLLNKVEDSKVFSKKEKAVKEVLGWLSEHSMDLITSVLPYIIKAVGLG